MTETHYEATERRRQQRRGPSTEDAEQLATLTHYLTLNPEEREERRDAYRTFEVNRRRAQFDRRRKDDQHDGR